jgi:hypothetical protein
MRRRWSDRSSRRVRTLVTQLARSRLIRESGRMRADIHDGPEQTLQSEAGYSNARPHQPGRRNLLHRTAGPYIGSIATRIDHSGHIRLSLNSGSTEDIAVGPVRAMNGSHPSRKSRPKSLYSRSEGNCSALLASAVGGSLYSRIDVRGHFFTISYPGHSILGLRLVLNLKS